MERVIKHVFTDPAQAADPRIKLVDRTDLAGVAPATVVLAQIDPLRSEGQAYADVLQKAGVPVVVQQYDGVTHEFFGMGAAVDKAKQAQQFAAGRPREAFGMPAQDAAAPATGAPATAPPQKTHPQRLRRGDGRTGLAWRPARRMGTDGHDDGGRVSGHPPVVA